MSACRMQRRPERKPDGIQDKLDGGGGGGGGGGGSRNIPCCIGSSAPTKAAKAWSKPPSFWRVLEHRMHIRIWAEPGRSLRD